MRQENLITTLYIQNALYLLKILKHAKKQESMAYIQEKRELIEIALRKPRHCNK